MTSVSGFRLPAGPRSTPGKEDRPLRAGAEMSFPRLLSVRIGAPEGP
jgi:hypothetical protein